MAERYIRGKAKRLAGMVEEHVRMLKDPVFIALLVLFLLLLALLIKTLA